MIDMGQCEVSLRRSTEPHPIMCWTVALGKAAKLMGFNHHMEVPEHRVESLKVLAVTLRSNHGNN